MGLKALLKKHVSQTGFAVLQAMLLVAFVALANLVASWAQFSWDLSEGGVHTLSDRTVRLLGQLNSPVRITLVTNEPEPGAEALGQRFQGASPRIAFEAIAADQDPERAAAYEVDADRFVVVESGNAKRWIPQMREQSLLSAIVQVSKGGDKKILFTQGHGERALVGGEDSLVRASDLLEEAGYRVETSRLTEEAIRDAEVIVVASPRADLSDEARRLVLSRVEAGAGLLVLLDPDSADWAELLREFHVFPTSEKIIELDSSWRAQGYAENTIYSHYYLPGEHPIAQRATPRLRPFFFDARALALAKPDNSEDTLVPIATSSDQSRGQFEADGKTNWAPPRARVIMAAGRSGAGRVVVCGTASFASNRFFEMAGNRELWELAVSWLAGDLDTPLLAQKEPLKTFGFNGPRDPRLNTVFVVCVLVLPGAAAVGALFVFIKRTA